MINLRQVLIFLSNFFFLKFQLILNQEQIFDHRSVEKFGLFKKIKKKIPINYYRKFKMVNLHQVLITFFF